MKTKRGKASFLTALITIGVLIAIVHATLHLLVYGTGIPHVNEQGVSGLAIGKFSLEHDFKAKYTNVSPMSLIILIVEWTLLISTFLFIVARKKQNLKQELMSIHLESKKSKNKTDLDILHDLLKEKKSLKIATVSKIFEVDKEQALEWAKILQSGNLATLEYPSIGGPELNIVE